MSPHHHEPDDASEQDKPSKRWRTLPNWVTAVRVLGSPGLIFLAMAGKPFWLTAFAVLLVFTEWFDGFLARRLDVTSALGARLDTIADGIFYSSLLSAVVILRPGMISRETIWIVMAVASYLLSWLASGIKFRCLPSYHTWAAKGVWGIVGLGILFLLSDTSPWPFRIAMACVAVANLEAICITMVLPKCKVDVPTLWHALRPSRYPAG
jgi:CDP-diacylglycerol--glycerol-3-phosphate 3-phosphatidyltransferase